MLLFALGVDFNTPSKALLVEVEDQGWVGVLDELAIRRLRELLVH